MTINDVYMILIAVFSATCVYFTAPKAWGRWFLAVIGLLSVIVIYVLSPHHRIHSFHGFMHTGVTYHILEGGMPPWNPFAANEPLMYHWYWHAFIAFIMKVIPVTPYTIVAYVNLTALVFCMILTYKFAGLLIKDRAAQTYATAIALFGMGFLDRGPIGKYIQYLFDIPMHARAVPIVQKFANHNVMPTATIFFIGAAYFICRILIKNEVSLKNLLWLTFHSIVLAIFYPLMFVAYLGGAGVTLTGLALIKSKYRRHCFLMLGVVGFSFLVTYPFLSEITSGRAPTSMPRLSLRPKMLWSHTQILRTIFPTFVLVAIMFGWLRKKCKDSEVGVWVLTSFFILYTGLFWVSRIPGEAEYKFLYMGKYFLGLFGGFCLYQIYQHKRWFCYIFLILTFLPLGNAIIKKVGREYKPFRYEERGYYLIHDSPGQHELYTWVQKNTSVKDIFIDERLYLPVFAGRSLYLGADNDRRTRGYGFTMRDLMTSSFGMGFKQYRTREVLQWPFIKRGPITDENIDAVIESIGPFDGHLYVVARRPGKKKMMRTNPRFQKVFGNTQAELYRLT